jgi:hypothetical protein
MFTFFLTTHGTHLSAKRLTACETRENSLEAIASNRRFMGVPVEYRWIGIENHGPRRLAKSPAERYPTELATDTG